MASFQFWFATQSLGMGLRSCTGCTAIAPARSNPQPNCSHRANIPMSKADGAEAIARPLEHGHPFSSHQIALRRRGLVWYDSHLQGSACPSARGSSACDPIDIGRFEYLPPLPIDLKAAHDLKRQVIGPSLTIRMLRRRRQPLRKVWRWRKRTGRPVGTAARSRCSLTLSGLPRLFRSCVARFLCHPDVKEWDGTARVSAGVRRKVLDRVEAGRAVADVARDLAISDLHVAASRPDRPRPGVGAVQRREGRAGRGEAAHRSAGGRAGGAPARDRAVEGGGAPKRPIRRDRGDG